MSTAIVPEVRKPNGSETQALAPVTPMQIIQIAIEKNASADELAKLLDLQLRFEANEARKAYIQAMQAFKANAPTILKTKHVGYGSGNSRVDYDHAELDKICDVLIPELAKHGLSHHWKTSPVENGRIRVTCVLTHALGHSEEAATLDSAPDQSGSKNPIQAMASAKTYLERYTFLSAVGMAAKGTDNDGRTTTMPLNAVEEYCIVMRDCMNAGDLQKAFNEAYLKAKEAKDTAAMQEFIRVKDQRKRDLGL
jgi:hypothetical protein